MIKVPDARATCFGWFDLTLKIILCYEILVNDIGWFTVGWVSGFENVYLVLTNRYYCTLVGIIVFCLDNLYEDPCLFICIKE